MATDLQIIFPSEALRVTGLVELERPTAFAPRRVRATGSDFRAVAEVLINGMESPAVTVEGENQLVAEVPAAIGTDDVSSFEVLSSRVTLTDRSVLRFRLGNPTRKATGILRLMQFYLRVLITTPGRDIFAPSIGGDVLRAVGGTAGSQEGQQALAGVVVALDRTTRQVIALQARQVRTPRDELLLSAAVETARVDRSTASLTAVVAITSQAGKVGRALVTT